VAERGRTFMPFDLDRTTHTFTPTSDGLAVESRRFRAGDFSDPAHIHGPAMPGLAQLAAGAPRIDITYEDVPAGALIRFRSTDPALVAALHAWGAAQTSDHGSHATS